MALAATADFDEYVLEVEFTAASGTYQTVCGLTDVTVNRTNNTDTTEVPDCGDLSLPFSLKKAVRSTDVNISATGVWALSSHQAVMNWFTTGATKNVRITNAKVTDGGTAGDTETETFPMILTALNNSRTKGQVVTAEITMERNGDTTFGLIS